MRERTEIFYSWYIVKVILTTTVSPLIIRPPNPKKLLAETGLVPYWQTLDSSIILCYHLISTCVLWAIPPTICISIFIFEQYTCTIKVSIKHFMQSCKQNHCFTVLHRIRWNRITSSFDGFQLARLRTPSVAGIFLDLTFAKLCTFKPCTHWFCFTKYFDPINITFY